MVNSSLKMAGERISLSNPADFDDDFPFWIPCDPTSLACLAGVAATATALIILLMGVLAYLIILIGDNYRPKAKMALLKYTTPNTAEHHLSVPSDGETSESDTNSDLSDYNLPQISYRNAFAGVYGNENQKKVE